MLDSRSRDDRLLNLRSSNGIQPNVLSVAAAAAALLASVFGGACTGANQPTEVERTDPGAQDRLLLQRLQQENAELARRIAVLEATGAQPAATTITTADLALLQQKQAALDQRIGELEKSRATSTATADELAELDRLKLENAALVARIQQSQLTPIAELSNSAIDLNTLRTENARLREQLDRASAARSPAPVVIPAAPTRSIRSGVNHGSHTSHASHSSHGSHRSHR